MFDTTASELKASLAVRNPREALDSFELASVKYAELAASRRMQKYNALGNEQTVEQTKAASMAVRLVMDDCN